MADRTDPARPPGPWPTADEPGRIFDHGAHWCANAAGHPGEGDYPDPAVHIPEFECRSLAFFVDTLADLDRATTGLAIYAARPFRFGQPRAGQSTDPTRIVLDTELQRLSLSLGDALRLARFVNRLVDAVDHA
jgi:hypothetical protein